jgi:hypothetical protein
MTRACTCRSKFSKQCWRQQAAAAGSGGSSEEEGEDEEPEEAVAGTAHPRTFGGRRVEQLGQLIGQRLFLWHAACGSP